MWTSARHAKSEKRLTSHQLRSKSLHPMVIWISVSLILAGKPYLAVKSRIILCCPRIFSRPFFFFFLCPLLMYIYHTVNNQEEMGLKVCSYYILRCWSLDRISFRIKHFANSRDHRRRSAMLCRWMRIWLQFLSRKVPHKERAASSGFLISCPNILFHAKWSSFHEHVSTASLMLCSIAFVIKRPSSDWVDNWFTGFA